MCQPEAPADNPAVAKEFLDLVRVGGGPDVEVLRPAVQQQIADASPDEIRDVIVLVELIKNLESSRIDVATGYCMRGSRKDGWFHHHLGL
jgi:hypothetical protein